MASAATTKVETLGQPQSSDPNLNPTPHPEELRPTTTTTNASAAPPPSGGAGEKNTSDAGGGDDGGPVTDTQKKIRRAERFGLAVHLSEQEKRDSRAER